MLLVAITAAAVLLRKRSPYLLAGWLWYLGTLVPVIGLIQVGSQAYADRYTYFPQIGIIIALAWGFADLTAYRPRAALAAVAMAAVILAVLTVRQQLRVWINSLTLWENDLRVANSSPEALDHLGQALANNGRLQEATTRYRQALHLDPTFARAHSNLGNCLLRPGKNR